MLLVPKLLEIYAVAERKIPIHYMCTSTFRLDATGTNHLEIRFSRIYGSDKQHQRADALLDFSSDPKIKIMLLSMKAGAVGKLTGMKRIHLS